MECIPPTPFAPPSTPTGIVVSEAVEANIPKRPMAVDEKAFGQGNPDRNYREVPAGEVREVEIVRSGNRSCVLP